MENNEAIMINAKKAAEMAYCPYSEFKVGACVLFESGKFYTGCNVENSSYGLALCAERNAISTAIASGEKSKLIKIAIYSPNLKKCFPCGACRQWIQEFAAGYNAEIILEDETGNCCSYYINDLLPYSFSLTGAKYGEEQ
ncbi:MAG: cytidine deaminase [Candidatus Gastranaerophilales bacterium]|nr:cytidine deaminase [Candidatus Gastranaerophilales bacterium]